MTRNRTALWAAGLCGLLAFACGGKASEKAPAATATESAKTTAKPSPMDAKPALSKTELPTETAAAPAKPSDARTHGVDVSQDQGDVDWAQVKAAGVEFGYAKATGGLTINDEKFAANWTGMAKAGVLRGAYHFFYAGDPPEQQVDHFLQIANDLGPSDLPPMVDVEPGSMVEMPDMAPATVQANVIQYLEALEKKTGRRPIIYTDPDFADKYLSDPKLARYPLWIAQYEVDEPTPSKVWNEAGWTIWQYSESGTVAGIEGEVDRDVFKGSKEQLEALP